MDPLWMFVLAASLSVFLIKLLGYLLPQKLLEGPAISRVAGLVTVALLASLVASQTLGEGSGIGVDARIPAVAVAGVLLWLRAPFIVVIIVAAAAAALLRFLGWMP